MSGASHARVAVLVLAAGLAACGPQRRSVPLEGPLLLASTELARGERLFSRDCQGCHPRGEAGLGPALNDKPLPEWAIRLQVRRGFGAMPGFPPEELSDEELDAVVRYLKAVRDPRPALR